MWLEIKIISTCGGDNTKYGVYFIITVSFPSCLLPSIIKTCGEKILKFLIFCDWQYVPNCTVSFTLNKPLKMTKSAFCSPYWGIFEMLRSFTRLPSWYFNNNMCFTPIRALCCGGSANQNAVSVTRADWPAINSVSQLSSFFCFRVSVESSRKAADQHQLEKSQQFCVTLLC